MHIAWLSIDSHEWSVKPAFGPFHMVCPPSLVAYGLLGVVLNTCCQCVLKRSVVCSVCDVLTELVIH